MVVKLRTARSGNWERVDSIVDVTIAFSLPSILETSLSVSVSVSVHRAHLYSHLMKRVKCKYSPPSATRRECNNKIGRDREKEKKKFSDQLIVLDGETLPHSISESAKRALTMAR